MVPILFVCKHNTFRSRVAEAYAKNESPCLEAYSGGVFVGDGLSPVQKKVIKKLGLHLSKQESIKIVDLKRTDMVVIVADDVPVFPLFIDERYGKKEIIVWDVPDISEGHTEADVIKIIDEIHEKINKLKRCLIEKNIDSDTV